MEIVSSRYKHSSYIVEAQLDEVRALEIYQDEIRRAEQVASDEAVALSVYAEEEEKLLRDILSKPSPSCTCCVSPLKYESSRRMLSCGHLYCKDCIATRCRMAVRDRSMVPAHCCKREYPSDYVEEALNTAEFNTYKQFLNEKPWRSLDLQSDRDYANVVQQNNGVQCPGCGMGVQRIAGCNHMTCLNGHEFCYTCGRQWKTCLH
ncbi:hypothetical protein CCR75_007891 [Bremia lactucae]|uniref:RING-type domain-containing protein n=1 Tax=Bremia lactucae TaxID=4779 RepID=A0A976FKG3_BRELC|nr:hypothetical protein CCR75_007891 [Bremia lactucae]